ncbi:MAG: MinD/ParA family protein [Halobacteriaceae archaeon]
MIVAVCGGKGGVGKSTVALNLAAESGAVVVDADLGMANLPTARGPDLHDVLAGRAAPVEAVREGGRVPVLPCGRSLAGARAADPAALVDCLERVDGAYGAVVVDCPAGLRADAGLPLFAADACVPVTTPARPAVTDALRTRAAADEFDAGVLRVVLNRSGGETPAERVARAFGALAVAVPESAAVAEAQAAGRPVADLAPASVPAERFAKLAGAVEELG